MLTKVSFPAGSRVSTAFISRTEHGLFLFDESYRFGRFGGKTTGINRWVSIFDVKIKKRRESDKETRKRKDCFTPWCRHMFWFLWSKIYIFYISALFKYAQPNPLCWSTIHINSTGFISGAEVYLISMRFAPGAVPFGTTISNTPFSNLAVTLSTWQCGGSPIWRWNRP